MVDQALFEKWKKNLGVETEPVTYEMERGHIRRFADAIEDPNPLWNDESQARKTRYGGIIATPTFTRALLDRSDDDSLGREARVLDAGSEYEYFHPIKVGDRITVTSKLVDLFQKTGRMGTMTFHVREITFTNQFGQVAATRKDTSIAY